MENPSQPTQNPEKMPSGSSAPSPQENLLDISSLRKTQHLSKPQQTDLQPAGFSETAQRATLELKARMLSGEKIPIEEIKKFILAANEDLQVGRLKRVKPLKAEDVSFF